MPFLKPLKQLSTWNKDDKAVRNGFRIATYGGPDGKDKYIGEFKNDVKQGKGIQYYSNGTVYEGDWAQGTREGHGVLSVNCGHGIQSRIYTGSWLKDKAHGFGQRKYKDGSLFKGMFCQGRRHGYGCKYYPDGQIYMGQWVNDRQTGVGRLIQPDTKNYYEGSFRNGIKRGRGRYLHLNSGQVQDGVWDGVPKVSMMWDDKWIRSVAKEPTPFPIPPVHVTEPLAIFVVAALPVCEETKN